MDFGLYLDLLGISVSNNHFIVVILAILAAVFLLACLASFTAIQLR